MKQLFCYAKLIEPLVLLRRNILRRNNSSEAKAQFPLLLRRRIVKIMVDADMRTIGLRPIGAGDKIIKEKFPQRWWKMD